MSQRMLILLACLLGALAPARAGAQSRDTAALRVQLEERLQREGLTPAEALERVRALGLSREQIRLELVRRGYDPELADAYYDLLETSGGGSAARRDFTRSLEAAGLASPAGQAAGRASLDPSALEEEDDGLLDALLGGAPAESLAPGELPVFGRSFFSFAGGRVDSPAFGPVDASYQLGPGDEVNVVLTGAVQDVYRLRVGRDGTLVVPEAGEVGVAGLTLGGLEDVLRRRFADVYAGVGTSAGAQTRVSVSLGRARALQVYVIGDVERPGAYQVSAVGTVLSALYRAGGPSRTGSFREIEVRRGPAVMRRFDLYEYLLRGNSAIDQRLEQGDVVFVPPVTRRVKVTGAVKRPAVYEVLPGDSLRTAIAFAGGPEAEAALRSVQIERILPPLERVGGADRVLLDVDVLQLLATREEDVALADGDEIRVFAVPAERRNVVTVVGEVRRPGSYGWAPGATLRQVVERASGPTEAAYTGRAHVFRLDPATGGRRLVAGSLAVEAPELALEDRDSVVIYSRDDLRTESYVTVGGEVKRPGRYVLAEGATVADVILAAGGFAEGAYRREAYVARPTLGDVRTDSTARAFRVGLDSAGVGAGVAADVAGAGFELRHGDRVEIRQAPGYEPAATVVVTGEVALPGAYVLQTREDRLTTVLAAAGGFTDEAFERGVQVVRQGDVVPTDLPGALQRPESAANLVLQPGDSIHVPRREATVLVTGAVAQRTRVLYRPDMSLQDYIREAGGFTRAADKNKTSVVYLNGERRTVRAKLLLPDSHPRPEPGSTVVVPEKPAGVRDGINWSSLLTQVIAAAGATATLLIALDQLNK